MASVFRCERCFNLSEDADGNKRPNGEHAGTIALRRTDASKWTSGGDDEDGEHAGLDVCLECLKNLDVWIGDRARKPRDKKTRVGFDAPELPYETILHREYGVTWDVIVDALKERGLDVDVSERCIKVAQTVVSGPK